MILSLHVIYITIHFQNNYILYSPTLYSMVITTCKVCGGAYETTEEDANIPRRCAGAWDRLCPTCYRFYYKNGAAAKMVEE